MSDTEDTLDPEILTAASWTYPFPYKPTADPSEVLEEQVLEEDPETDILSEEQMKRLFAVRMVKDLIPDKVVEDQLLVAEWVVTGLVDLNLTWYYRKSQEARQ